MTVIDASDASFSSIGEVSEGQPVCMLGLKLHILVAAATFNLHTRLAVPGGLVRPKEQWSRRAAQRRHMRILDRSVYLGPSLCARFLVIRLELDLGTLEAWPTGRLAPGFIDALAAALPALPNMVALTKEPGGFFRRMREEQGTWLGHVLEHVAIELQNTAGKEVTFGKTRSAGPPGVYPVLYEYAQSDEGIAAGDLGLRLLVFAPADGDPACRFRALRLELAGSA